MSIEIPVRQWTGAAEAAPGEGGGIATVTPPVTVHGLAHHLLHRPSTAEGLMLGTVAPVPQDFTLSAALPDAHPLFNDGPGAFHDPNFALEAMRQSVLFVAHQYFRVPSQRPVVLASSESEIEP